MLKFDPHDPFPFIERRRFFLCRGAGSLEKVDEWLGMEVAKIENELQKKEATSHQLWIGLPPKKMLTPYTEIRSLLQELNPKPGSRMIDLGAGYGRMGFVLGAHFPKVEFLGYEYVGERVRAAQKSLLRFNYPGVKWSRAI